MTEIKQRKTLKQNQNQNHHHLPHDIIEQHILTRLPAESLLRFRFVCKQWNSTISDYPRFLLSHLRQSRNSPCTRLLQDITRPPRRHDRRHTSPKLIDVSDANRIREISTVRFPPAKLLSLSDPPTLCHCDGLRLLQGRRRNDFVLWNPSTETYKSLSYPYPSQNRSPLIYGICYDPLITHNYKVVIGCEEGYAVFNCATDSWSETREACILSNKYSRYSGGASLKGSIYWAFHATYDGEDNRTVCEIVRFDGRDEKLKKVVHLDHATLGGALITSREALYVFIYYSYSSDLHVVKMECDEGKDEDEDEEVGVKVVPLPDECSWAVPKCWIDRDKIMVEVSPGGVFLLYDHNAESVDELKDHCSLDGLLLYPHMENLVSFNGRRKKHYLLCL